MLKVAVVEDEADLRDEIVDYLRLSTMEAVGVESWEELNRILAREALDAVVLDITLPGDDGLVIASRLTERQEIGIVMVTARGRVEDRVQGLKLGADAYLVKPVDLRELVATLESVARRIRRPRAENLVIDGEADGWVFDPLGWMLVSPDGISIRLTAAEHAFLAQLVLCPGRAVSRNDLAAATGYRSDETDNRHLDALVRRLRRKVETHARTTLPVQAVHAVGYAFTASVRLRNIAVSAGKSGR